MNKKALLQTTVWGAVVALPLSLLGTTAANAVPYAYASNVDSNFVITGISGSTGAGTPIGAPGGTGITGPGYTVSSTSFTSNNTVTANGLTGYSPNGTTLGPNPSPQTNGLAADASQQVDGPGPFPAENVTAESLNTATSNGIRADSSDTGFNGSGSNVAEGRVPAPQPAGGTAASGGSISSNTLIVTITTPERLQISFNDTPMQEVSTTNTLAGPFVETATSTIASSVLISSTGSGVNTRVFSFTPTAGGAGDTFGGTTLCDPFTLNQTASSQQATPADFVYNPTLTSTACATTVPVSSTPGPGGVGIPVTATGNNLFAAISNVLPVGTYQIVISQSSSISLVRGPVPAVVPEPASLALLGAGLVGLGMVRRSFKKSKSA